MNSVFRAVFKKRKSSAPKFAEIKQIPKEVSPTSGKSANKAMKNLKITFLNQMTIKMDISEESASSKTMGWLLEETKRKIREMDKTGKKSAEVAHIVALKTVAGILSIDYLLTLPERSLEVLPSSISLQTVLGAEEGENLVDQPLSLQDFELCGRIGNGAFAKIYLARKKQDGKFYAIKQLRKATANRKQIHRLIEEKDVMLISRDAGTVQLYATFQTEENCYFVMQFCPGGDMLNYLSSFRALSEGDAKYYVKTIVKTLKNPHAKGIIHRDLKPENVFLDLEGKIYLGDFGFSKHIDDHDLNLTICGTPKYYAPEIIVQEGYSFSVDYYNVGIIAYELVLNESPFHHRKNIDALMHDILHKKIDIPKHLTLEFQDFLQRLFIKNPKKRLGVNGADEILNHPWLKDAPTEPPMKLSHNMIERIVQKLSSETDTRILIDSKGWFGKRTPTQTRTYLDGFCFSSDRELDCLLPSSIVIKDHDTDNKVIQAKKGASQAESPETMKAGGPFDIPTSRNKFNFNGIESTIDFDIYLPTTSEDSAIIASEFGDYSDVNINGQYVFRPHSNSKNTQKKGL